MATLFPELMEKAKVDCFYIGEGWYSIVQDMLTIFYWNYQTANNSLRGVKLYPRDDNGAYLSKCEKWVEQEYKDLPVILQIKETYGHLRVYIDNDPDKNYSSTLRFAELASKRTCEVCGSIGYIGGEIHFATRCKIHHEEEIY